MPDFFELVRHLSPEEQTTPCRYVRGGRRSCNSGGARPSTSRHRQTGVDWGKASILECRMTRAPIKSGSRSSLPLINGTKATPALASQPIAIFLLVYHIWTNSGVPTSLRYGQPGP